MGVAYEPTIPLLPIRARRVVQIGLVLCVLVVAWGVWKTIQPPSFAEQYHALMEAELIGSTEFAFDRMSSPPSLAGPRESGMANVYGFFDGPGERDMVIYQIHSSEEAAREAFADQREQAAEYPKFYEKPFYEPGDYHVVTSGYAQWGTRLGNVVMLGESWRNASDDVEDRVLDQRAQSLLMIAMKNYLRVVSN